MSLDWNLSSDEEDGFDDWSKVDLYASSGQQQGGRIPATTAAAASNTNDADHSSDDDAFNNRRRNHASGVAFHYEDDKEEGDDDDEEEEIDWEDAGGEDEVEEGKDAPSSELATDNNGGGSGVARLLQPVTLDLNKSTDEKKKKKSSTTKRKLKYRYEQLAPHLQSFLLQLERTHLLGSTSHILYASKYCSNELVQNVAHSLIPPAWMTTTSPSPHGSDEGTLEGPAASAPTEEDLSNFCHFYFSLTNSNSNNNNYQSRGQYNNRRRQGGGGRATARKLIDGRGRRRRRNREDDDDEEEDNVDIHTSASYSTDTLKYRTLEYCRHLAQNSVSQGEFGPHDKVYLLIAMARSLGWRARYVMSIEPINRDLDVNHPVFVATATKNVFQKLWSETGGGRSTKKNGKKPSKRARKEGPQEIIDIDDDDDSDKKIRAKDPPKAAKPASDLLSSISSSPPPQSPSAVCWVEILCRSNTQEEQSSKKASRQNGKKNVSHSSSPPKMKWIHIDPHLGIVNEPEKVESILYAKRQQQEGITISSLNKKKCPVTYAIAAEHVLSAQPGNILRTRVADVTPRYAFSWIDTLKQRGVIRGKQTKVKESERPDKWLAEILKSINHNDYGRKRLQELRTKGTKLKDAIVLDHDDNNGQKEKEKLRSQGANVTDAIVLDNDNDGDVEDGYLRPAASPSKQHVDDDMNDHDEMDELKASIKDEPMPTSKTAFNSHPIYVIPSVMNTNEVLKPDAKKRVCGVFKGELVFRRTDVETAYPEKQWLYKGRKVKKNELRKPILRVKARKKTQSGFTALKSYGVGESNDGSMEAQQKQINDATKPLEDGKVNLYASWQTNPWSPPRVNPSDPIPVNDHNNVELALLNPGLVHLDKHRISVVAKKLGIPYAPCLLGFEGHHGNRTPTVRGIVVHEHNSEVLLEAHAEMASHFLEQEHAEKQNAIYKRWKRLLVGVLTKDRLERAYGDEDDE